MQFTSLCYLKTQQVHDPQYKPNVQAAQARYYSDFVDYCTWNVARLFVDIWNFPPFFCIFKNLPQKY